MLQVKYSDKHFIAAGFKQPCFKHSPVYTAVMIWKVWCKSLLSIRMVKCKPIHVYSESSCNPSPVHWKLIDCSMFAPPPALSPPQPTYHPHNPHTTPVTPISLHFHSCKGNSSTHIKKITIFIFIFFFTFLKLGNLKLCTSGSVCTHQKTSTLLNSETRCPLMNKC